jgi:hypothetical protein
VPWQLFHQLLDLCDISYKSSSLWLVLGQQYSKVKLDNKQKRIPGVYLMLSRLLFLISLSCPLFCEGAVYFGPMIERLFRSFASEVDIIWILRNLILWSSSIMSIHTIISVETSILSGGSEKVVTYIMVLRLFFFERILELQQINSVQKANQNEKILFHEEKQSWIHLVSMMMKNNLKLFLLQMITKTSNGRNIIYSVVVWKQQARWWKMRQI